MTDQNYDTAVLDENAQTTSAEANAADAPAEDTPADAGRSVDEAAFDPDEAFADPAAEASSAEDSDLSDAFDMPGDSSAAQEEEDPWAAALAEQEAAAPPEPEPLDEPPAPGDVRNGSGHVFKPLEHDEQPGETRDLDIIMNIPVKLNVELGRTKISIRNLLELTQGSVLELDGLAGDPMDILINGYLLAQGEVVVIEDKYGIRITDIITPSERVQKLNR